MKRGIEPLWRHGTVPAWAFAVHRRDDAARRFLEASVNQIQTQSRLGDGRTLHAAGALGALVIGVSLSSGCICIPPPLPPPALASAACLCGPASGANPEWHLNGRALRGTGLACATNKDRLIRPEISSFSLDGMTTSDNRPITGVHADNGALTGAIGATFVAAPAFEGVHLFATIGCIDITNSGATKGTGGVEARIDAVTPAPASSRGGDPPYYRYQISLHNPSSNAWDAACPAGGAAIPVAEVWDDTATPRTTAGAFTFACVDAAIGKCLEYGYLAWAGADKHDLHLACTRMVRADYCGDGASATNDGDEVNVWDRVTPQAIQPRAASRAGFTFEAAWDTRGAACYQHFRFRSIGPTCTTRTAPAGAVADRFGLIACASDANAPAGALVFDESMPQ
jgi:ADYC domain